MTDLWRSLADWWTRVPGPYIHSFPLAIQVTSAAHFHPANDLPAMSFLLHLLLLFHLHQPQHRSAERANGHVVIPLTYWTHKLSTGWSNEKSCLRNENRDYRLHMSTYSYWIPWSPTHKKFRPVGNFAWQCTISTWGSVNAAKTNMASLSKPRIAAKERMFWRRGRLFRANFQWMAAFSSDTNVAPRFVWWLGD